VWGLLKPAQKLPAPSADGATQLQRLNSMSGFPPDDTHSNHHMRGVPNLSNAKASPRARIGGGSEVHDGSRITSPAARYGAPFVRLWQNEAPLVS
jgi:hypothetical protein